MARRADERPPYEQVAADLRARIMAGDLEPGTRLPSTARLVEEFGVANTTVQKALAVLKGEGYLTSRQGKGVFVRDRQPFRVEVGAYFAPEPGGYSYDLLQVAEVTPPPEVAKALEQAADDRVQLRKRLLRHAGHAVEVDWSYYPLSLARGTELAGPRRIREGAQRVLAEAGHPQRYHVDKVSARMPTPEEADLLSLPNVPVLRQFRTVYTDADRPVEVSVLVKGTHLYELHYRLPV
ncbi:GntR family transcriptional regulator [Streptomonospora sp. S1-112]|uniref:GntR family transcriptional regulator n=1 Tax=Streptomonospora mangrovi TaxID=2883123 RepID=A0A9X3SFV1_9ACTN|nr:GntR family transcriptional regulator [Streptomonospora mangrovi]MDA0565260.1 GntR family transcriptional regulator [Streptomonospora mangrovi]